MIRTLAEVHADRVTVTVTLDTESSGRTDEVQERSNGELRRVVAELEAENARLADDFNTGQARSKDLESLLAEAHGRADRLDAELTKTTDSLIKVRKDRETLEAENTRAADNFREIQRQLAQSRDLVEFKNRVIGDCEKDLGKHRNKAERAEAELGRCRTRERELQARVKDMENRLAEQESEAQAVVLNLSTKIDKIKFAVTRNGIQPALGQVAKNTEQFQVLDEAVRDVWRIVGLPLNE